MVDARSNYVGLITGLSKATRARARTAARGVLAQAGLDEVAADAGERLSKLAEEILAASRANREMLENLVAAEVERAATRLGFVRADDLSAIRAELAALRARLDDLADPPEEPKASPTPAKKAAAKRAATAEKVASTDKTAAKPAAAKKAEAMPAEPAGTTTDMESGA